MKEPVFTDEQSIDELKEILEEQLNATGRNLQYDITNTFNQLTYPKGTLDPDKFDEESEIKFEANQPSPEELAKQQLLPGMIQQAKRLQNEEDMRIRCLGKAAENRFTEGNYDAGVHFMNLAVAHYFRKD